MSQRWSQPDITDARVVEYQQDGHGGNRSRESECPEGTLGHPILRPRRASPLFDRPPERSLFGIKPVRNIETVWGISLR